MGDAVKVQEHYAVGDTHARVDDALKAAGFTEDIIDWKELSQLDQFHMRGLAATQELASQMGVGQGQKVLDIGSGLGGPARYLAATFGCRVTGIELTPVFVEISKVLSQRTGLSEKLDFVEGNALRMPFEAHSFDSAWTQHVAMNIEDKDQLYREVARVLKPGGRLGIYDVVAGDGPITFPVPWASREDASFLISTDDIHAKLRVAGFEIVCAEDTTSQALDWYSEFQKTLQSGEARTPLNLGVILGPQAKKVTQNFATNLENGSAKLHQLVAIKTS